MKKIYEALMCLALFFVLAQTLPAQVTVVGHITAEVVSTITASETAQLSFGQFSPEKAGGQIILTPGGTRSSTGAVNVAGGMHNAGTFYVTGSPGSFISIQLPTGPATLTNSSAAGTLVVTNWTSDPPPQHCFIIPGSGTKPVNVGATLLVGNLRENPVGLYAGTYNITFNYN